jgi:hypothetical protein
MIKAPCNCESNKELTHDALHCPMCGHETKIMQALEVIAGIQEAALSKLNSAWGVPRGTIWQFSQPSPGQNTAYVSTPAPLDGVVSAFILSGLGDITVTLNSLSIPSGSLAIGTFSLNSTAALGTSFSMPLRFVVPANATLTLKTNATGATNISFAAWLEPAMANGSEFFRMRR